MLIPQNPHFLVEREIRAFEQLLKLWLHAKAPHTQRYYRREIERFFQFAQKSPEATTLADIQGWADWLAQSGLAQSSQARSLAAVKSFFSFAAKIGVLKANAAAPVALPKVKETLSERILPEAVVQAMLALEPNNRNRVLLKLLYGAGLRVSELCGLKWRDLQVRGTGGQISVYGKGSKTRVIRLPQRLWDELVGLSGEESNRDAPVFVSRKGRGHLKAVQVHRIVKQAAQRVPGLNPQVAEKVSAHWLRHAHASHSLDRGAPVHLVQATLGHSSLATTSKYVHARPEESSASYLPL